MRFIKNGPSIPDSLLAKCDQGRVVFLCGAGVSIPSGMPNFVELTRYVVEYFDPPAGSEISKAFTPCTEKSYGKPLVPLDQVFHLLYQEYGRDEVNAIVAKCLSIPIPSKPSHEHSLIAKISSDPEGRPQVITTNFDRLFNDCPGIETDRIFEPPEFPDIELGMPVHGVTYLHGRLREPDSHNHDYVLSSADFGRAYLAEGWATKFMRALLKKYTVVLVGYQAEDPPVNYLLQGLNYDEGRDRSNLFAFDKGDFEVIEVKWRDRGITPIAYNDHADLWKTLEAWADRANDPRAWRNNVVEMASQNPRDLHPHQRGQVAHLIRSTPGAKLFAQYEPSPPAEWLCVFDASCRAPKNSPSLEGHGKEFDPFEAYRLDDDPEHLQETNQYGVRIHDQLLEWRPGDINPPMGHTLAGRQIEGHEHIPPRLLYLLNWSSKHLSEPCLAWWATHYSDLHPRHISQISRQIRAMDDLHLKARRVWNLILEAMADKRHPDDDNSWFDLQSRIKSDGWTIGTLRSFDETMKPILSYRPPDGIARIRPPMGTWEDISMNEIAEWEIRFPNHHRKKPSVPEDVLLNVFQIADGHLRQAAGFHRDIGTKYFATPTCYPNREVHGKERDSDSDAYFRWFVELLCRMSNINAKALRLQALTWDHKDKFFFRKLKLFVLNDPRIFEANEAAELVLEFGQEDFWDYQIRRELLFLLADRWSGFTNEKKVALADRLLAGPEQTDYWSDEDYPSERVELAASYTKWLELQGCQLIAEQSFQLAEMIGEIPKWTDGIAASIVVERRTRFRSPKVDLDLGMLENAPVGEVIELAKTDRGPDYRTSTYTQRFLGLVESKPIMALAALSEAKKQNEYPVDLWQTMIQNWPDGVSTRLNWAFWHRLTDLPHETMRALAHPLAYRIGSDLKNLYARDPHRAWLIFDNVVSGLVLDGGSPIDSRIGESLVNSDVIQPSRRTYGHAINSPIGRITEGWVDTLNSLDIKQEDGIPVEFKVRLERLLRTPNEGRYYVIAIITRNINWLHGLEPDWVLDRIIPWFDLDHPAADPAWCGYLSAAEIPPQGIGVQLKPMLLKVFPEVYLRNWDRGLPAVAAAMIIELAIYHKGTPNSLTEKETRQCIRNMSDESRRDAILHLVAIGEENEGGWNKHVIPFIENTWPKERKYRTTEIVSAWADLLCRSGDSFPEMLKCIRRFLFPVVCAIYWLYRFIREDEGDEPLTIKYPDAVLEMLDAIIPSDPQAVPSDLDRVLELIKATDPKLARDRRYYRLIDIVEQR